jgi:hypothetical protein
MSQLKNIFWFMLCLLLVACSGSTKKTVSDNLIPDHPIPQQEILDLVCGSSNDCLQSICPDLDQCPIVIALSQPAIFKFVAEISTCEGCDTTDFSPINGIGKCIEYHVEDQNSLELVRINVSNHCNFRYAIPEQVEISVTLDTKDWHIIQIDPDLQYIQNPTYCVQNEDCFCLSGSGVPFIGCSNFFHAPLNWSGYYLGDECGCVDNKCSYLYNVD